MGFFEDHMLRLYPSLFHIPITLAILVVSVSLYRLYFHPLAHIPGPPFACVSSLFLYAICYLGVEGRVLLYYHEKYCVSVLRIAPDAVSLSGDDTLHQVYVAGGGLPKDARYQNFRVEGHDTIFSALDQDYRNERAKAVLPLFAPSRIQNAYDSDEVTASLVRKFIARLQEERASPNSKVDILDLSSRLSIDFLTAYLFHQPYGGLDEPTQHQTSSPKAPSPPLKWANKLSATPFVLSIVSFSRFSLLPNWAFNAIFSSLVARVLSNDEVSTSMRTVSRYADAVLGADENGQGGRSRETYQSRLLAAGITREETLVQCKAVMFAGADSTAVMLATILFHLVRRPEARARLRAEIAENETAGGDPQALPYLRAVVREGLRLGMANPARLTRIFLPPGTKVGAAAYVFHHNRSVFPQPFAFQPERWLPSPEDSPSDVEARRVREQTAFPFGLGSRACLGRNLASFQLHVAVKEVVASGVLEGSRTCADRIELIEWFNAEIKGHELEIQWN
ncbi:cytochrome P450 [Apiospora kogelbergensis]|uniref:Cytochrome P450 n=1 Tax=Apiospora kogelbergensis TaxID=1337665 RepID=A0AAW0QY82_9PEZI